MALSEKISNMRPDLSRTLIFKHILYILGLRGTELVVENQKIGL